MHEDTRLEVFSKVSLGLGVEGFLAQFARGCQFVTEQGGDGTGYEEQHRTGEEEAVGNPLVVEHAVGLSIEGAEEAFDATD
jgi:hypothetical protein